MHTSGKESHQYRGILEVMSGELTPTESLIPGEPRDVVSPGLERTQSSGCLHNWRSSGETLPSMKDNVAAVIP